MSPTFATDCAVTITALPGSLRADVRIVGDVDLAAVQVLTDAVGRLSERAPRSVFVDLAGVTFAGSALPNFLMQAHSRMPRGSFLVVSRPSPTTIVVLVATGVMDILTVCDSRLARVPPGGSDPERADQALQLGGHPGEFFGGVL
jgi:anti-anti-sigma factor